ncbi:class I adenylate-forming enzyme family protein [Saccharopolyspora sp. 5N708]|uniref:class I adenylate-forming enzyme family protein n=1 Tax=Saccharopolyspora sp. 5N708 TaxID=3457424 RepID=UPI003FD00127
MSADRALTAAHLTDFAARITDETPTTAPPNFDDVLDDVQRLGLRPGALVVVALPNTATTIHILLALLHLETVPMAISPATPSSRITALTGQLGADALITTKPGPARHRTQPVATATATPLGTPRVRYEPGEFVILTSGTSGIFSACVHRLDALLRNAAKHAHAVGLRPDDTVLVNLPLHYSYAIVAQVLAAFTTGAHLVISGPPFSPPAYHAMLNRHDITSSSITPTIARTLLEHRTKLPDQLRMLTVGGDHLAPTDTRELLALHPHELYLTYGLTEAGPRVSTLAAHTEPAQRHGSAGLPLPGVHVELRDVQPETGIGELLITTDTALTRRTDGHPPLLPTGQLATGDLFSLDDDGYLHFHGRRSEFVVLRGEKVSLFTIRQAAHRIPGVLRCTPHLATTPDGTTHLDLELHIDNPAQAEEIRGTLNRFLLPKERPRRIDINTGTTPELQK